MDIHTIETTYDQDLHAYIHVGSTMYNGQKLLVRIVTETSEVNEEICSMMVDSFIMYKGQLDDERNWVCRNCGGRIVPIGNPCPVCGEKE